MSDMSDIIGVRLAQQEAADLADQIMLLFQDSEKIYSTPDGPAEMAAIKLQCNVALGRLRAMQAKTGRLSAVMEKAKEAAMQENSTQKESIAATCAMLGQYAALLKAKEAAVKDRAGVLDTAEKMLRI